MKTEEDEAFEELSRRQGDWGLQGSRKHQILRFTENVESKGTSMTQDVLKYLQPNAAIPIDMETTSLLVNALKKALSEHAMRETQRLGQEIEQEPVADYIAARDMLDAKPVPPRTWVGLTDEDMYVVSEEESCSFIAGAKWSEAILKEKNT